MVELKDKTKLYAANRLQSLRQKIGPANAEARRTGDYSEVYKLYVELEKLSDVKNLQTQEAFKSYVQDEARTTSLEYACSWFRSNTTICYRKYTRCVISVKFCSTNYNR